MKIAYLFGKKRIIIWGGVLTSNSSAIKYYEKIGFKKLNTINTFIDGHDDKCVDMILEI